MSCTNWNGNKMVMGKILMEGVKGGNSKKSEKKKKTEKKGKLE